MVIFVCGTLIFLGTDKAIQIYDAIENKYIDRFTGHLDSVSGLAFRENTHQLFSVSFDRALKIWSVDEMAYVDTLYFF